MGNQLQLTAINFRPKIAEPKPRSPNGRPQGE